MFRLVASIVTASLLTGCAGFAFSSRRVIAAPVELYSETMANELVTENVLSQKTGEGCATSILGLVSTGDASVATAAAKAGITRIAVVDNKFNDILGVYAKYCVIVTGE